MVLLIVLTILFHMCVLAWRLQLTAQLRRPPLWPAVEGPAALGRRPRRDRRVERRRAARRGPGQRADACRGRPQRRLLRLGPQHQHRARLHAHVHLRAPAPVRPRLRRAPRLTPRRIWLPADTFGIGRSEVADLRKRDIAATTSGANADEKATISIERPPPVRHRFSRPSLTSPGAAVDRVCQREREGAQGLNSVIRTTRPYFRLPSCSVSLHTPLDHTTGPFVLAELATATQWTRRKCGDASRAHHCSQAAQLSPLKPLPIRRRVDRSSQISVAAQCSV